jgi:hypothetical protein
VSILIQFQLRQDSAANWSSANPVLAQGEQALDTTSGRIKVGDGATAWNSLAYSQNTILHGAGAPGAGLGVNGDIYFDDTNKGYYAKAAGSWGSIISLQGAAGTPGTAGSPGVGVPTGGATNSGLFKINATDYNTQWLTPTQMTALFDAATTSLKGLLTAADKRKLNNMWVDVTTDYGLVGDDSTDNLAAWNAMLAAVAGNSTIYFPPGTYRFSGEAAIPYDKHLNFEGGGERVSILKTMSATANLVNLSGTGGNAWYNTFRDLGFASGVTKTAGAHLAITAAASIGIDIERCAFDGHFIAIDAQGAQAGNVSVWNNLAISQPAVNGRGIRINGSVINLVISNSTINSVPNAGAIAGSANIEVNQSGAVQIIGCDLIGGVNSLLINANQGGGTSVAAIYVTNTFFDQSGGSTIKITGANTSDRIKFTQCGIAAGLIGTHAVEVNGTGTGGVGSATAMPAGISFIDCDVYYAPGSSTASGFMVNGCQDINIQDTRVAGFSGAGGAGIHVIPSTLNQTRVRINGCRIGPNSNLTINNLVGIQLDLGSSGLGALSISDCDLAGNGTAYINNSTMAANAVGSINNNAGTALGWTTVTAKALSVAATSTNVDINGGLPIPPNIRPGTKLRCTVRATNAATINALTVVTRFGTANTNADGVMGVNNALTAGTAVVGSGTFIFEFTFLSATTMDVNMQFFNGNNAATGIVGAATAFFALATPGTIATTAQSYLGIYFSPSVANIVTIRSVAWEVVSA